MAATHSFDHQNPCVMARCANERPPAWLHTLLLTIRPTAHLLFRDGGIKGMVLQRTFDKASY